MNVIKVFLGIGLILMSSFGFVFADENDNLTINETVINDTLLENISNETNISDELIDNLTINETVINDTLLENISNETDDDNETATSVIISEYSDTEKYLDFISENLESYKFWILMVLIVVSGYLVYTKLL
jgi:adenylate kinase family enzyme